MASLAKKGKHFYIVYRERRPAKSRSGKIVLAAKQIWKSTGITDEALAEEVFRQWEREHERKRAYGRLGISLPALTLEELWDAYSSSLEGQDKRENTLISYRGSINNLSAWLTHRYGSADLHRLSFEELEEYIKYRRHGQGYRSGANKDIAQLKAIFNWAAAHGLMPEGVMNGIKKAKVSRREPRILADDEVRRLFSSADAIDKDAGKDSDRLGLTVRLAYYCGLRPGENHALLFSSLSADMSTIKIVDVPEASFEVKTSMERVLPLEPSLTAMIKKLGPMPGSPFLHGYRSRERLFRNDWARVLEMSEIGEFQFRHLRHNFALRFSQLTKSERLTRLMMGHSKETDTLIDHYMDRSSFYPVSKLWDEKWIARLRDGY